MADLSTVQNRQQSRDRLTNRRSGVLPEKRDTRLPDFQPAGDMRSARRGDGGADQLRAIFGSIEKAGNAFADYADVKQADKDKDSTAEGALDSLTGEQDPVLAAKSKAYRTAYSQGKSERDVLSLMDAGTTEAEALLNDPDNQATPDDIDEFLHARMKEFLMPEGKERDFGSPEAKATAYKHLREWSAKVRSGALAKITEQVATESLNNASDNVRMRLKQGLPVTLKDFNDQLLDSVDPKSAQEGFLGAVQGVVEELKLKDPQRAIAILRMVEGEAASASGDVASPEDLAAEAAVPQGDPLAPAPAAAAAPASAPRAPGRAISQDEVIRHTIIDLEGGDAVVNYSQADGGVTKYGIAAKFNPGVDVAKLTQAQATEITKRRYWFKELNSADPVSAAIAFDAGFIGGTTTGKKILAAAGGDPEKALGLYRAHLNRIADTVPGKAQYKRGWNNRVSRLAAKLGLTGSAVVGDDVGTILNIPTVDGNVPRPPSAADMAEIAPLDGSVPALAGRGFSLTQEQRNRLRQFKVATLKDIKDDEARVTKERYASGATAMLGRFIGIGGSKPTVADVQSAVLAGEIEPEVGYQTVQRLETDAREDRSEARQARGEAREVAAVAREAAKERNDHRINAFLEPVFSGRMTIPEATAALLARSNAITDVDERNEFRQSVYRELTGVQTLRTEGAPYKTYMRSMDNLGGELKSMIPITVRGDLRKRIEAEVDAGIARAKVEGGRLGQDTKVDMGSLEERMEKTIVEGFKKKGYHTGTPSIRRR